MLKTTQSRDKLPTFQIGIAATRQDSQLLRHMYQVTFSEQSMIELNKLDKLAQMEVIEPISSLTPGVLKKPREPLGSFTRGNKTFYRLRAGEYRIYFEKIAEETLLVEYLLHAKTLEDFLLRTKLPVSEEQLIKQDSKIWSWLEGLKPGKASKPNKK